MLLRFEVENFGSFLATASLTMSAPARSDADTRELPLAPRTTTAALVYGPNGSGKTTLLDALAALVQAVRFSHNRWEPQQPTTARPFLLRPAPEQAPTTWLLEVAAGGGVFRYRAAMTQQAVTEESLQFKAGTGRFRSVFRREGQQVRSPHRGLRALQPRLRRNALLLSLAAQENDTVTAALFAYLVDRVFLVRDADEPNRLRQVVGEADLAILTELARLADIGIEEVRGIQWTQEERERQRQLDRRLAEVLPGLSLAVPTGDFADLEFAHQGPDGQRYWLVEGQESHGTSAFLAAGLHARRALAVGGLLVIDEVERSLHPSLVDALIGWFRSPLTNPLGAQVLATTHDTHLFGRNSLNPLSRHEVWLTEKGPDGASSLFRLSDFPDGRPTADREHRYLAGRYGAVPYVRPMGG